MLKGKFLSAALFVCGIFIASNAFAEDCNNLGNNAEWRSGMAEIQSLYQSNEYNKALDKAKALYAICSISPTLLYYTGLILDEQGDDERALIYYQKASENISQMGVEPGIARQIWYARYEGEHPDRTEEAVAIKDDTISILSKQAAEYEAQSKMASTEAFSESADKIQTLLWTGVGVGGGGLVMLVAGAVLLGMDRNPLDGLNENPNRAAGWAMLGAGIGLTVVGAVTAGIAGYHYSKTKEDAVLSFGVSPTGASFGMTF